jgi:hypothetical protein
MLSLHIFRTTLPNEVIQLFSELKAEIGRELRPLLQPTLETPASILGVAANDIRRSISSPRDPLFERTEIAIDGELFTDGESLLLVAIHEQGQKLRRSRQRRTFVEDQEEGSIRLEVSAIGLRRESEALSTALTAVHQVLGVTPSRFSYPSDHFDALKTEGRESPAQPSEEELHASELLRDRASRTLAIAIKASGGLLVRDIPKQLQHLPPEAQNRSESLIEALKLAHVIDSEIVIVCSKTQAQVTRAGNREILNEPSMRGLKCACGRRLIDERIEEALTITELGRGLLDKARWLTVLLLRELEAVGVSRDAVLVEQNVGGDEIDCLANISGELALFELKDKEFNLGNAYSFGAKIGIIRPRHPIIVSTEHVGNDAKEHFVRARLSSASREAYLTLGEERSEIIYIEGVQNLREKIEELASNIYRADAIQLLNQVLPLAALDGNSILSALDRVPARQEAAVGDSA